MYPSVGTPTAVLMRSISGGRGTRSTHSSDISSGAVFQIFSLYGSRYLFVSASPKT